jgi:predicted  nucleic acid-binding Zn-ribbon protein
VLCCVVWLEEGHQRMQGRMTLEDKIAELEQKITEMEEKIKQYEEWLDHARTHNKQRNVTKYIDLISQSRKNASAARSNLDKLYIEKQILQGVFPQQQQPNRGNH